MEARSKNGVVGRTGMNTPIIPNANEVEPINISKFFLYLISLVPRLLFL